MKKLIKCLSLFSLLILSLCFSETIRAQCSSNTIQGNCVKFVRSVVNPMPSTDLTSYSAKLSIINHNFPTVGSVAIMPAPGNLAQYGHVSVVRAVTVKADGKLSLTLEESNWGDCAVTTRPNITPESRNIQGYYDPRYYNSPHSTPKINGLTNFTGVTAKELLVGVSGAGFDTGSVEAIIMGGWCDSFGKCKVTNNLIQEKTSTGMKIPVTLNSAQTYTLYLFNSQSGKTSNGQQIIINNP
jgi:hypothetical protein